MYGMSYFVRLGKQAKQKIGEWRLPAEGIRAILQGMDELSEIPNATCSGSIRPNTSSSLTSSIAIPGRLRGIASSR
jgi:hypothetical protein